MAVDVKPTLRTVKQIVDKDGTAFKATLTSGVWVGHEQVFSRPQEGNKITPFVTGAEYFSDLVESIRGARSEICILGWQVNWDAMLAPGLRLYDVLLEAAKKNVKIFVMPWDDSKPMLTYDTQTKAVLESINAHPEVKADLVNVLLSKSLASKNNGYFSHHQKQVIVDRAIAYIGGIDLAYGRYDDATYDLRCNASGREVLNRYNSCVPSLQRLATDLLVDPDRMTGFWDRYKRDTSYAPTNATVEMRKVAAGGWQMPYATPGTVGIAVNSVTGVSKFEHNAPLPMTLDPVRQPRMPWQDVHTRIEGPSVSDLLRNFVVRWNASGGARMPMPRHPSEYEKVGNAYIQVLRSAPATMREAEYRAQLPRPAVAPAGGTEDDIHRAMVQLIEKSSRFIYIESQFFVSAFGEEAKTKDPDLSPAAQFIGTFGGADQNGSAGLAAKLDQDSHAHLRREGLKPYIEVDTRDAYRPPSNKVCLALVKRIERAILDASSPNFHVYITIPVHPEGSFMNTAFIAVQIYWTMQTISFGTNSLLNGIRRALKAKELHSKNDSNYRRVIDDLSNQEYLDIPVEACFRYVTLLNLRNWEKIGESKEARYVTEQIYVHSKLMVVDDLYALLGTANINDRSLLGERDSEIAVLVMDGDSHRADICGNGSQRPVRAYAHELRKKIWKKIFGITGGVRPANNLVQAIEQPGIPDSWHLIQKQADFNANAFESAFSYIPKNWIASGSDGTTLPASIIPNWDRLEQSPNSKDSFAGYPASPLPFQEEFWRTPRHNNNAVSGLEQIRGFITSLPVFWTQGEMNRFDYPTSMVAANEAKENSSQSEVAEQRVEPSAKLAKVKPAGGVA